MTDIDTFLAIVDAYCEATRLAEATVSDRVMNDGKRIKAIRAGRDIGVRRMREAVRWFSDNWPAEQPWPSQIERPPRVLERAAS
jgi:hypothetical protein